jgi:hypothetical protein
VELNLMAWYTVYIIYDFDILLLAAGVLIYSAYQEKKCQL